MSLQDFYGAVERILIDGNPLDPEQYLSIDITALPPGAVAEILLSDYWNFYHFDLLPAPYNIRVFDIAINCGGKAAIQSLQRALAALGHDIHPDGVIGPNTVGAISVALPELLTEAFINELYDLYARCAPDSDYLPAWVARHSEAPDAPR